MPSNQQDANTATNPVLQCRELMQLLAGHDPTLGSPEHTWCLGTWIGLEWKWER